ncbi:hypothetical protein [Aminipila sp.]|uniref:hypothetical protein n=1 Tax=Aminipila sp. TaxID=2060095 RepID=UPI00289E8A07|nr:hypothetical protein [Aminipila sp.]
MRFRNVRPLMGILLITLSVVALWWWENLGREQFIMESVMVAKDNIEKGRVIKESDFIEIRSMSESTVPGAITPKSLYQIKGFVANQYIPKLSQVVPKMFTEKGQILGEGKSIFPIKDIWIDSRSSSLRKGDVIDIFSEEGSVYMGTYPIAYVKDENEQEVVNTENNPSDEILQRHFSSSVIAHVEIIADLEEYKKIRDVAEEQNIKLLIIQKGESINE